MEQASGLTIVALHGLLQDGKTMEALVEELSIKNRLITLDLIGHGDLQSLECPSCVQHYVEHLHKELDNLDIEQAVFLGYSFGGFIAREFAKKYPNRVDGLVLVSAFVDRVETIKDRLRTRTAIALVSTLGLKRISRILKLFRYFRKENSFAALLEQNDDQHILAVLRMLMRFKADPSSLTTTPTMVIAGERDLFLDKCETERLASLHGVQPIFILGAGHNLLETNIDQFLSHLHGFLTSPP